MRMPIAIMSANVGIVLCPPLVQYRTQAAQMSTSKCSMRHARGHRRAKAVVPDRNCSNVIARISVCIVVYNGRERTSQAGV